MQRHTNGKQADGTPCKEKEKNRALAQMPPLRRYKTNKRLIMGKFIISDEEMDALESKCIYMRSHGAIIYCYPFDWRVAKEGAKVMTRTGKTVRRVVMGKDFVTGDIDGVQMRWDKAGRFDGPYKDSPNDLYISERYFYREWKSWAKMGYAEWNALYGRPHPAVKIAETHDV